MNHGKSDKVFILKGQTYVPSCKLFQGDCICEDVYIDETKTIVIIRWVAHNNQTLDSAPA